MGQYVTLRSAKKVKRVRNGTLPELEDALLRYMRDIMRFMNNQTLFRQTVVGQKALEVRKRLVSNLEKTVDEDMSDARRTRIIEQRRVYSEFKASDERIACINAS